LFALLSSPSHVYQDLLCVLWPLLGRIRMTEQQYMRDPVMGQKQPHSMWSACPNCSQDLSTDPIGSKPPHTFCPFCRVPLSHVWWQRTLVTAIALVLAYGVPASLGVRGIMPLLFVGLLLYFPALVVAMVLIFKVIRPKYVRKAGAVTTLFQR
jgi:hypothetical protein